MFLLLLKGKKDQRAADKPPRPHHTLRIKLKLPSINKNMSKGKKDTPVINKKQKISCKTQR